MSAPSPGPRACCESFFIRRAFRRRRRSRCPTGDLDRADLLVGDRLIIECDSEAHHAEPSHRRADLRRDELLVALGYLVLRLDYRQVFDDPSGVVAVVEAIVARREHLSARPTRPG